MNIAIGKIAKSLKFDKEYRKAGKGDLAPMATYIALANKYPEHNFYVIGSSDLHTSAISEEAKKMNEIPDNIIDIGIIAKERMKSDVATAELFNNEPKHKYLSEYLVDVINEKNLKFDYGVFFIGPDMTTNTGFTYKIKLWQKEKKKELSKALEMAKNYSAPIIHTLNTFKFPYILVNEDPRYVPYMPSDLIHRETCILSHLNAKCKVNVFQGYFDDSLKPMKKHEESYIYAGIERTSLKFLKKYDFRHKEDFVVNEKHYKKDGFVFVACNESPNRFNNIKNWILDNFQSVKVYGNWNENTIKGYEDRFEAKSMAYLQDDMWRAKYTYIPGFFDKMTNFVTIKIWEMCIYGILPFFDKSKYDTDNLVPVPEFLRCATPQEMKEKIEILEKDPELYQEYLNKIYELVNDDYFNGEFICKIFEPIFKKESSNLTLDDWRENSFYVIDEYALK